MHQSLHRRFVGLKSLGIYGTLEAAAEVAALETELTTLKTRQAPEILYGNTGVAERNG